MKPDIVFKSFLLALRDLFKARIILVYLAPLFVTFVIWLALTYFFWDDLIRHLPGFQYGRVLTACQEASDPTSGMGFMARMLLTNFLCSAKVFSFLNVLISILVFMILPFPIFYFFNLLVNSFLIFPQVLKVVRLEYPIGFKETNPSIASAMFYIGSLCVMFMLLWLVSFPIWMLSGFILPLPLILSTYFNKKIICYDALNGLTGDESRQRILKSRYRGSLWLIALGVSLLTYIPIVNLVAILFGSLMFSHFIALAQYEELRKSQLKDGTPRF